MIITFFEPSTHYVQRMSSQDNTGTTKVTSHGQTGGITAGTVNVNHHGSPPPPAPEGPKRRWVAVVVAIIGVAAALVAVLEYFGIGPWELFVADKPINVTSYNQSGGVTAGTVNVIAPRPRTMTDQLAAQILRDIPRDKEIVVMALLGDAESYRFASQIHAFMKGNGFRLREDGISQGVYTPPPVGFNVDTREATHWTLIVGSAQ